MKYQSPSTYHSKVIAKVKVTDRMTEGQKEQKQYAPHLRSRGHKKVVKHEITKICPKICNFVIIANFSFCTLSPSIFTFVS